MGKKIYSIAEAYFFSLNLIIVLTLFITFGVVFQSSYSRFDSQMELYREGFYQSRKDDMKSDVESAIILIDLERSKVRRTMELELEDYIINAQRMVDYYYQLHYKESTKEEMIRQVAEMLRPFRFFNGEGYYFMISGSGYEVLYPIFPELEGQYVLGWTDSKGVKFCKEMVDNGKKFGHGHLYYQIKRPGETGANHLKLAYYVYNKDLDLLIGSGYYLDYMEEVAREKALDTLELFSENRVDPFFGANYNGVSLIGSNRGINRLTNPVGNSAAIITDLTAIAKEGGGFYEYQMPPLDEESLEQTKLSYVMPYPDWNWYIGTGTYMEKFTQSIDVEENLVRRDILNNLKTVVIVLLIIYVILILLLQYLSMPIRKASQVFARELERAVDKDLPLDLESLKFKEFHSLGERTNQILLSKKKSQQALFQKQKLEAIGRLAGGVAHDINNQLTAVMGYADLISAHELNDEVHQYLDNLLEGAYRASNMVRELLRFSRKEKIKNERVDLHDILERIRVFLDHVSEKGVTIRMELGALDHFIVGDDNKLYSLFLNLAINSVDSFEKGGLIILNTRNLENPHILQVEVRDNGCGINPEDLDKIFELFYTTKPAFKGTGLGLSLVYDIVKEHRGIISVESEPGKGSCFRIQFPLNPGDSLEPSE